MYTGGSSSFNSETRQTEPWLRHCKRYF